MKPLYLYLAGRDKSGMTLLSVFDSREEYPPTRIHDVKSINLPPILATAIENTIRDNRMSMEAWAESAEDYNTLRKQLQDRGYTNLPLYSAPLHSAPTTPPATEDDQTETEPPVTLRLPPSKNSRTMLRKAQPRRT
jgi:hypothetical protein